MSHIIEQLYDKYGAALYGMIMYNVKDKTAATEIMQQVFSYVNTNNIDKDPGLSKLLNLAKQFTCVYMGDHKEKFSQEQIGQQCNEITNDYILQLATLGRFTISQLSNMLSMEETTLKQKIQQAIKEFRNKLTPAVAISI